MTIIDGIAERLGRITFDDLPPEAVHWAKLAIRDTLACALAGAREPCATIVEETLGAGSGPCLIFGSGRRAPALDAALANGTAAHALDFDDLSDSLGGHPSAPILPALLALAETNEVDGSAFLTAFVAGFETEARIGCGVNFHHYEKGWHPTATLGVFGATAACCHLLRLEPEKTSQALAIAASLASGLKANFGTMTKPLHVGHTARNGLFAAFLGRGGFTANSAALEHKQGFLTVFNGAGNFDAEAILRDWGRPYDIVSPGIGIKQYPCCASTHPAVDAMLALREAHGLRPEMVERVQSWTHPRRLAHTNRPDPQSALDAKFSVQYCLARSLAEGRVVLEHFDDEAHRDAAIRGLMAHIEAAPYAEGSAGAGDLGAELQITLKDGRTLAGSVECAQGRGPDHPLSETALAGKFADCARRLLAPTAVARLNDLLLRLESLASAHEITAAIAPPRREAAA